MKNPFILFFIVHFVFFYTPSFAQIEEPINSGLIIKEARQFSNDEKYEEAYAHLEKIDRNDTNYVFALSEMAEVLLLARKYDSTITVCQKGLEANIASSNNAFYINMAVALIRKKEYDKGIKLLEETIKIYPNQYLLYHNLGVAYNSSGNPEKALEYFKKSVTLNPYYAQSHLSIALMATEEGKVSQAMMAYNMFLILETGTSRANNVLSKMHDIVTSKYKREPSNIDLSPNGADDFSEQDLIITNYAALDKSYKIPVKVSLSVIKQNHALLSKLDIAEEDKGFWNQTYVPFFVSLSKSGLFEGFTYHILQSSYNDTHKKLVSKNAEKIKQFASWARINIGKMQQIRPAILNGETVNAMHVYNNKNILEVVGTYNSETKKMEGYAEVYYSDGNIYGSGVLNQNGNREGKWIYYYQNGNIAEELNFKDGKHHGTFNVYHSNGKLKKSGKYQDGVQYDTQKWYNKNGLLTEVDAISDGKFNGEFTIYYNLGSDFLNYKGTYLDDKLQDTLFEYYDDGKLASQKVFKNGSTNGDYASFYRNGQVANQFKLINGNREGLYKSYYKNGKLREEGEYKNGVSIGIWKSYYEDGTIEEESIIDEAGKKNGIVKTYDYDGKLHYEMEYKKGVILAYKYYSKDGKVIKEDRRKKGDFELVGYYPNGIKKMEGIYSNLGKKGEWKYYDIYGNLSTIENFDQQGLVSGKITDYYPNGDLKVETNYEKDEKNGYSISYYTNKVKKAEGWYENGKLHGYWNYYFPNGTIDSKNYYLKGKLKGYQEYYSINGKLRKEEFIENELLTQVKYYDTTETLFETVKLENGTGNYKTNFVNGKPQFDAHYIYGIAHGNFTWKYPNGKTQSAGKYYNNNQHGLWVWYNSDGVKTRETNYEYGSREGNSTSYHANGKPYETGDYLNDEPHGESYWYYDNGKLEIKKTYVNGKEEGPAYYYSPDGELQMVRYYEQGETVAYTYNDKDGKLLPKTSLNQAEYKVLTYYQNGNKAREYSVSKGLFHSTYTEYFSNGKVAGITEYAYGRREGTSIEYFENGNKKDERNYISNYYDGPHKTWHPNGKLKSSVTYITGEAHGPALFYDTNGKLKFRKFFYSDLLVKIEQVK
jgi:antitoxin component YwqK of YwqJK toxin-antitoxin module/Tfp pilus assembly protein PilF